MDILTPNTGDELMDRAYTNMQTHINSFDKFDEFFNYFSKIVKTDDKESLNKWLLKVLFVDMKRDNTKIVKHKFDLLLEKVDEQKKQQLIKWLDDNLQKVGGD